MTFSPALKRGDSFSLCASYADVLVGMPSHARGGRHRPNYWAEAQILAPDVDRSDTIPMEVESAGRALVDPTPGLVPLVATGALLRGVRLILKCHPHAQPLGLVSDHPADLAGDHLVDPLVGRGAVVHPLPQIPHIADDHRLHPACVEGGDQEVRVERCTHACIIPQAEE